MHRLQQLVRFGLRYNDLWEELGTQDQVTCSFRVVTRWLVKMMPTTAT